MCKTPDAPFHDLCSPPPGTSPDITSVLKTQIGGKPPTIAPVTAVFTNPLHDQRCFSENLIVDSPPQ